jgi:hypothetical protein
MSARKPANSKYTWSEILSARDYWRELTNIDLLYFWRHYTVGKGKGMYSHVKENTGFYDYLVESANQSSFEKAYDL